MPVTVAITSLPTSIHVAVRIRLTTVLQTRVITRKQLAAATVQVDITATVQADAMALLGIMAAIQTEIAATGEAGPLSQARHRQQTDARRGRVPWGQRRMGQMELGPPVACRRMSREALTVVPAECNRLTSFPTTTGLRYRDVATLNFPLGYRQSSRLRAHASGRIGTEDKLTDC